MADYKLIDNNDIAHFIHIIGGQYVLTDSDALDKRSSDYTEDLHYMPQVVLLPCSTAEISQVMAHCHKECIAVTPRGAGTGLSGGALPVYGGVLIDLARMNSIVHIDKENFQVTTQPAVITQVLQEAVGAEGMYYPPDPASRGSCFIGGNVAENSGGPRAVKYGTVKDYVLNLEVVLANGDVIWTGANVLKNATGYNLTQLIVGSEGTLGIITQIVLRLIPTVPHRLSMLVPFKSATAACAAVNVILLKGFVPSALEFMERHSIEYAMAYTQHHAIALEPDTEAHLLIELDGSSKEQLYTEAEAVALVAEQCGGGSVLLADNEHLTNTIWMLRRKVGEAVKSQSIYKEEDTVVPRAKLPQLLNTVKSLGREYGFRSVCYGHAGDGNLHINILRDNLDDDAWNVHLITAIETLFKEVVAMGGTISGEHGIGLVQRRYMPIAFSPVVLAIMKGIKHLLDPKGIMNPCKIF